MVWGSWPSMWMPSIAKVVAPGSGISLMLAEAFVLASVILASSGFARWVVSLASISANLGRAANVALSYITILSVSECLPIAVGFTLCHVKATEDVFL